MASFTVYLARLSRPSHKTALAATATALLGTTAGLCYVKNEREDPSELVLRRQSSLNVTKCESTAGNAVTKMDRVKPKSSDPTDYAGGSGNLNTVSNDEDGLVSTRAFVYRHCSYMNVSYNSLFSELTALY